MKNTYFLDKIQFPDSWFQDNYKDIFNFMQVKEQKLGVLQRKCQSIEDKLQDLRKQKKDLHTRLR